MFGRYIKRIIIIITGAMLVLVGVYIYNTMDVSSQAVRYRLEALCGGIYEYHMATGQWPGKSGDFLSHPQAPAWQ